MTDEEEEREKLLGEDAIPLDSWGSDIVDVRYEIGLFQTYWPYNDTTILNTHMGKYRINLPIEEFEKIVQRKVDEYNNDFDVDVVGDFGMSRLEKKGE